MDRRLFFPMFVDLSMKRALVVGAGRIAARRAGVLMDFCGQVVVVGPKVHPDLEALAASGRVTLDRRAFAPGDLENAGLVVAATDDPSLNARIAGLCRERGVPVNVASDRTLCDFYFPGVVIDGEAVIGVTAGGGDHHRAKALTDLVRRCVAGENK